MNRQPNTAELRRLQIGARAALVAGIVASVAANVAAAQPTVIGRVVAGWSPAALFITVELITRLPARTGPLAVARLAATGAVAAIAAWISYHHIVEVALRAGESPTSARLLPLSVDGMMLVASLTLVEVGQALGSRDAASSDRARAVSNSGEQADPVNETRERPALTEGEVDRSTSIPSHWRVARP